MTEKMITEVTLECLMNKEKYEKYKNQNCGKQLLTNKKDKKFYRRRIYDLTKRLLYPVGTDSVETTPDIKYNFDAFVKSCIEYFQALDKTDILQEDFKDFLGDENDNENENENDKINAEESVNEADQLLLRSIKIREPNSLEKLVKRKTIKVENEVQHPQQKDINLQDPVLKNKGIRKKKNIKNTYDKNKNTKEKIQNE